MDFDTTYGDQLYDKIIKDNKFYKLFHDYVYSEEFVNYFINIFKEDINNEHKLGFLSDNFENSKIHCNPYEVGGVISKNEINKENEIKENFDTLLKLKRVTTRILACYLIPFYKKENS